MTDTIGLVVEEIDKVTSNPGDTDQEQVNMLTLISLKILISDSSKTSAMWSVFKVGKWAALAIGSAYIVQATLSFFW